jgi:prevent-host-death family protein
MTDRHVSSTEFQKAFGRIREAALKTPVTITHHGRESLVLVAAEEFRRLKSRDRRALHVAELSDAEMTAILEAEIPPEASAFDDEFDQH